ncbi:MAG: acyl-CoA dehydrogenase family protein [Polyangiales bacterium]
MDFGFTDDQRMLRDTVRDVLTRTCVPDTVRKVWNGEHATNDAWRTLAETGVLGMAASEAAGGMAMGEVDWVLLLEEAGYAALPAPLSETMAIGLPLLEACGTDAQKDRWLRAVIEGDAKISIALADESLVFYAAQSDIVLVERGRQLYLVPTDELGARAQSVVDRAISVSSIDGVPGAQYAMRTVDADTLALAKARAMLATAAQLVGLSRRMLDMSVQYAKDREQFGKPIGAQQAIKHRLANALIRQEFARPLVYRAAWELQNRTDEHAAAVLLAKIYATEAARFVAKEALQVHGAIGYTIECDLHMWMKRVWTLSATHGTVRAHRERLAGLVL